MTVLHKILWISADVAIMYVALVVWCAVRWNHGSED
jgi:hypothetical protein